MPCQRQGRVVCRRPRGRLPPAPGLVTAPRLQAGRLARLAGCGLTPIESASFVWPKWVPQMGDADKGMSGIKRKPGVRYSVLTPNLRGFENALAAGVDEVAVFGAASESFSQKNINASIEEAFARFAATLEEARHLAMRVRGQLPCSVECPFYG